MKTARVLCHLARAAWLERVRGYSFLLVLGATVCLGYAVTSGQIGLRLGNYRGVYDSAWVGLLTALATTFFLSLAGFYVVKNALERDRRSGVGPIIVATPAGKLRYILGQALGNLAVLATIAAVLAAAAAAMQLLRGEDAQIRIWPLVSPFLLIALPVLAVVAALAVLFETIPVLRGGLGNVAYLVLWLLTLTNVSFHISPLLDLHGIHLVGDTFRAVSAGGLGVGGGVSIDIVRVPSLQTFRWAGFSWTLEAVLGRLYWFGVALALVLAAAALFDRFAPVGDFWQRVEVQFQSLLEAQRTRAERSRRGQRRGPRPAAAPPAAGPIPAPPPPQLAPLTEPVGRPVLAFGQALLAELRLLLKGQPWWWYVVALVLIAAGLRSPIEAVRELALPLAWLWPLRIWSTLGVREARYRTEELVCCAAHPLRRQLPATWLAGVVVAALAGSGVLLRWVLEGNWEHLPVWITGALLIPTLALALGVWSRSSKPFEVLYPLWWYLGPLSQVAGLNFLGMSPESLAAGVPLYYLGLAGLLLGLAVLGRWRRLLL